MLSTLQSIFGLIVFACIAWLLSENRKRVRLKGVAAGLSMQLVLGFVLLRLPLFKRAFLSLNGIVLALQNATAAGTSFVFGYLGGGTFPFDVKAPEASFILAFQALPLVLLISALSSLFFYWRILPLVVRGFSWVMEKSFGLGGAEGLGVSANVFVGMVEAPLFIRPYLSRLTRSELFSIMSCGMATIAGTVMVLYAGILRDVIPGAMGHILTASIISVPASVTVAKIMVPETGAATPGRLELQDQPTSAMDAVTRGTLQGANLLVNILAMLIVLIALVYLFNEMLSLLPQWNAKPVTLQRIFGVLMAPVAWLMGVAPRETVTAGALLGTKTVLNELIAYIDLSRLAPGALSPRSLLIMTYALCGFANPGSLGIMIGGMGTMAPERRPEIVALGLRSIVAGTLAACMTGAVAGILG